MNHQMESREEKQRLFFGIAVNQWVAELSSIQQLLKQQLQKQSHHIAWHPPESLHITLVFLGETNLKKKKEIEQRVQQQLAEFSIKSIEIKVTQLTLLSGRHIIIAFDAPELNKLHEQLNMAIPKNNMKREKNFYAHLALGKLKDIRIAKHVYTIFERIKLNALHPISIQEFYLYLSKPRRQYQPLIAYSLSGKIIKDFSQFKITESSNKKWEHFSHDADIGVRGWGKTIEEAFEMTAMALTGVIANVKKIDPQESIEISCSAPDIEILLVDWLNAIIFQIETRQMLFSQFYVEINDLQLKATLKGELINREKHYPAVDVKGATFTELKVQQQNGLWIAQCVLDV